MHRSSEPESLVELIKALKRLPGIGVRTATRIAYYLLQYDLEGANLLSQALTSAVENLCHCSRCNSLSEKKICTICSDPCRDSSILCIVENPADLNALEDSRSYHGLYYVLMGRLEPLEGIGPYELNFKQVLDRALDGKIREIILATNSTAEGETTAHFLSELLNKYKITVSRLARGIPASSELEYLDTNTIALALIERKQMQD